MASAARARAAGPWAPDFVWLRAKVLLARGRYDKPAAAALLDSAWSRLKPDAPLYLVRAEALNIYVPGARPAIDTAALQHQEALVDSALALEPAYYEAWSWKANQHAMRGRPGAAAEAMRRAVLAAPASPTAHADYWQRLRQIHSGMIPPDTLDPDVARLLEASQRSAGALLVSSQIYAGAVRHDRAAALEAELRRRFPGSYEVERADLRRIDELYVGLMVQQPGEASADRTELRRRARAFTSRSHALGGVYEKWLDVAARERSVPDAEVAEVAGKALAYGKPSAASVRAAALRLAEHRATRPLATRLAQAYPALARGQRVVLHTSDPDTAAARRRLEREDAGIVRDVLGWSAFHAGRSRSAEAEIRRAVELAPGDPIIRYHMGRLAEGRGDLAAAEAAYTAGLARESPGGDRPNLPALRSLLALPGVRASIREHAAATLAANTEARKAAVLATRISRPRPLPRFDLERLAGGRFSTDSLRGRVAFVNFWGVWCAPCVRELPDIQKLYDRYRNDAAVTLITIDNDPDANMVREFLKVRKLDFPVLRADSVVQQMNIGYPTTWIVDRQGRIAYDDSGEPPQDRAQEWAWRIESLKGKRSP